MVKVVCLFPGKKPVLADNVEKPKHNLQNPYKFIAAHTAEKESRNVVEAVGRKKKSFSCNADGILVREHL